MNETMYIDGLFAQLACLWELTARKPGNVHRFKDFADTTYLDFAASAAAIAPVIAVAHEATVGVTIYNCVCMSRLVTRRNTNLGIILLFAPLAKAMDQPDYRGNVEQVLSEMTLEDARWAYEGIRMANPGGLGKAEDQDVCSEPTLPLRQAMALASERDLVARQYANGFREVFDDGVPELLAGVARTGCVEGGIIHAYLHLMSRYPDTLIARKRGNAEARESAERAQRVLDRGWPQTDDGQREIITFDGWLRSKGHSRNPGTTADLIAASVFVLLRTRRITIRPELPWPLAEGAP